MFRNVQSPQSVLIKALSWLWELVLELKSDVMSLISFFFGLPTKIISLFVMARKLAVAHPVNTLVVIVIFSGFVALSIVYEQYRLMAVHLLFGLSIFLFGMKIMEKHLKRVAGDRMKQWLESLTQKPRYGLLTGTITTGIIQSSSVITVMLVTLVSSGMMPFANTIAVILGANIGTTITAQLMSFKIVEYVWYIFVAGFVFTWVKSNARVSGLGMIIIGLALIFHGMGEMSDAMHPLRGSEDFKVWLSQMDVPWKGILAGALFTALVQSSSATMGVVIVLASVGSAGEAPLISLEAGIALAFGANIGTCITVVIAVIDKINTSREAVRVAVMHVLANVFGVIVFYFLIKELAAFVSSETLPIKQQIANAHTVFNVGIAAALIWWTKLIARGIERLVPDLPFVPETVIRPKYLLSEKDLQATDGTEVALIGVQKEIHRMGQKVRDMFQAALPAVLDGTKEQLDRVAKMDTDINILYEAIVKNIGSINLTSRAENTFFVRLSVYPELLESAGDVVKSNLLKDGYDRLEKGITISEGTRQRIIKLHHRVLRKLDWMLEVIHDGGIVMSKEDEQAIETLLEKVRKSEKLFKKGRKLVDGLKTTAYDAGDWDRLPAIAIESDIVEHLESFYDKIQHMASVKRLQFVEPDADIDMEDEMDKSASAA